MWGSAKIKTIWAQGMAGHPKGRDKSSHQGHPGQDWEAEWADVA